MKTGYDQHFNKIKRTIKPPGFDLKSHKNDLSGRSPKKQKKSAFPLIPLLSFIFIAGAGLILLDGAESIEAFFKKIEISVGIAQAAEKAHEVPAPVAVAAVPVPGSEAKTTTVEPKKIDDSEYLFKLADRKKQLDQRESELNKLAEQIEKQKTEITEKLNKLEETRIKISKALEEKIKVDDGKVETLVQMYTNMKPAQAAKIFETLDEDLVIEILGRMKKKSAADILNLIKPEKAQTFAERFTGYRTPANK